MEIHYLKSTSKLEEKYKLCISFKYAKIQNFTHFSSFYIKKKQLTFCIEIFEFGTFLPISVEFILENGLR